MNTHSDFERLVLGCIDSYDSESRRVFQIFRDLGYHLAYSSVGNCRRPMLNKDRPQNGRATLKKSATLNSSGPCRDVVDA